MPAAVALSDKALDVSPGQAASTQLTVRNTGAVVDEFRIEVVGAAAAWATIDPPIVRLFPNTEMTVSVQFAPPRDPSSRAGAVAFGVKATPSEDPAGSAVDEGVLQVGEFNDVFAELVPRTVQGRRRARPDLAVDNRGNRTINLDATGADEAGALKIDVSPPGIHGDPGTASFSRVELKPAKTFWRGQPRTHPFKVVLQDEGQPPLEVAGTMVQDPLLPKWFWKALLALLALLLLLLILWFTLLKPSIKSEATDAANAAVKQQAPALAQQAAAAGAAAGKAAAKGQPIPTGSSTTSTTAASTRPPGNPIDFRLFASSPTTTTQTESFSGKKFSMTDIIFQNPNADKGTMQIIRNGEVLFEVSLDNFRDLDYHFVSAIVFDNTDLVFKVLCNNGGASCTSAATFSGYVASH